MPSSLQGLIIALIISLLVGIIIGYSLRQGRINEYSKALKESQKRAEALEQAHERRLEEATTQLQKDYEAQLAEKIERYQDQLEQKAAQLEQDYQARVALMQPPALGITPEPMPTETSPSADLRQVEQAVKQQYELRLREAARKIQQAYEKHLRDKLSSSREALQAEYEQRLAQKIEHYEEQLALRLRQLEQDFAARPGSGVGTTWGALGGISTGPVSPEPTADLEAQLRQEYEQKLAETIEHYQNDMAQRIASLESEYEARLQIMQPSQSAETVVLDDITGSALAAQYEAEYEQKLAAKIEHYQNDMTRRLQEMEADYEARLQAVQPAAPQGEAGSAEVPPETLTAIAAQYEAEYEQKLAEKIERYQDDMARRLQDLETEYEARLSVQAAPDIAPEAVDAETVGIYEVMTEAETRVEPSAETAETATLAFEDTPPDLGEMLDFTPESGAEDSPFDFSAPPPEPEAIETPDLDADFTPAEEPAWALESSFAETDSTADRGLDDELDFGPTDEDMAFDLGATPPELETITPAAEGTEEDPFGFGDAFDAPGEADDLSLDAVLSLEHAPALDESLDLDSEDDSEEVDLDELLFEDSESEAAENKPYNLDDFSNLS